MNLASFPAMLTSYGAIIQWNCHGMPDAAACRRIS
jgi:hypothetical protein